MAGRRLKPEDFEPRELVACASDLCPRPATIRQKMQTGWANFCVECYKKKHQENSEKWCVENGLLTTEQKIEFCRATAKKWGLRLPRNWGQVEREPGQDDEELAA